MSTTPLAKYRYRRRLPHLQRADADIFITFCTARWQLPGPARDLVLEHCLREAGVARAPSPANCRPRIHLHAVVIMPDHVHMLLLPLRDEGGWPYPLVDILQCLKSATAHRINKLQHRCGPVWEEESFDHILRSEETLKTESRIPAPEPSKEKSGHNAGRLSMDLGKSQTHVARAPPPANARSVTNADAGGGARATLTHKSKRPI